MNNANTDKADADLDGIGDVCDNNEGDGGFEPGVAEPVCAGIVEPSTDGGSIADGGSGGGSLGGLVLGMLLLVQFIGRRMFTVNQ